ncbi:hypothetical protein BCR36DRAFT_411578 [Piromyces finnis]|uniref:DUF3835 domain-containing protein n=1 Tax=Piromyces finnis TaxID=1754191 RepID=A0A1Y1VBU1_9FUNG|nr:hypothetical protein BCR36DRAFT_411578 [Piromyces finnis]|eukprot:ORX52130.1 hypothetical protein BCR36DRAFT_411578 [Piromyces finnis]
MDINKVVSSKEIEIYQNALNKSIKDTNANIKKWDEYKNDYINLKKVLKDLPNEIQHEAMIPFSKLAFFPGKLIHTNEILVLLGDNWFVERSAKQSCEIVDRRLKFVNENIYKLKKDKKELEQKVKLTEKSLPIKHDELNEEGMNYVEIREDYDEDEEAKLNEITDKTSKIHIDMKDEGKKKKQLSAEDEAIFKMLQQAELEEEMENEKNKEKEYEEFIKSLKEYDEDNGEDEKGKKKADSDEEDEEQDEDEDVNFEQLKEKFNLYKEKEIKKINKEENNDNNKKDFIDMSQIRNPADIYKHIYQINEQAKKNKSELEQKDKNNEIVEPENTQKNNTVKETVKETPISSSPFTSNVVEKKVKENSYIANIKPKQPKKKKSSLFKSHMMEQRKKQDIVENIEQSSIKKDIVVSNPKPVMKNIVKEQTITAGVKSVVQEHNVNNNYRETTPRKKGKVSLFKKMAEAQNAQDNGQSINKQATKSVPIMQNAIKENPNNTAMDEDAIDFYFTQREANQEYQKRKYQKTLIAKEKPLEEYDNDENVKDYE